MEQEGRKWLARMAQTQVKGQRTLDAMHHMGRLHAFVQAVDSPIGIELIKDLAARYDKLLGKIALVEASDLEKIEYQVVAEIIHAWTLRIQTYLDGVKKLDGSKIKETV